MDVDWVLRYRGLRAVLLRPLDHHLTIGPIGYLKNESLGLENPRRESEI